MNAKPIDTLIALVKDDLEKVNALVIDNMQSEVKLIPQLGHYLIASGGKRLRPLLTLACSHLVNYTGNSHIKLATAVEFIHTATLLHDDVVDDSDLRRGKKVANQVYGNKPAILVGDFLFSRAFMLMVSCESISVLDCLANASATIAQGEVAQMQATGNIATDEATYLHIIESKTAALFAAACESAGILAKIDAKQIDALRIYGHHLGIGFQMADDILDYDEKGTRLGKKAGDDFREGKITLPAILAYQDGSEDEKAFWQRTLGQLQQTDDDFNHARNLIARHGAIHRSLDSAHKHAQQAIDALAIFPSTSLKSALEAVAWQAVKRH